MTAALVTMERAAVRPAPEDEEPEEPSDGDAMADDERELLREQIAEVATGIERLRARYESLASRSDTDHALLLGAGGSDGLVQLLAAMRERLAAYEREAATAYSHSTAMFKLALEQQNQVSESLRVEIRSVTANLHDVRADVDQRYRDIEDAIGRHIDVAAAAFGEKVTAVDKRLDGQAKAVVRTNLVNAFWVLVGLAVAAQAVVSLLGAR